MTGTLGCSRELHTKSRIVVVVDAAPGVASEATALRVDAGSGAPRVIALGTPAVWPVVFTLVPGENQSSGEVTVEAMAGPGSAPRVVASRRARVRFVAQAKRFWSVRLARCEAGCGDEQTCTACGTCAAVDDAPLRAADPREQGGEACDPDGPSDAGADAAGDGDTDASAEPMDELDAGEPDAGDHDAGDHDAGDHDAGDHDAGDGDGGGDTCDDEQARAAVVALQRPMVVLDFDGDTLPDLAVGRPDATEEGLANVGSVDVYRGASWDGSRFTEPALHWTQELTSTGSRNEAGDLCGFALAAGDFNGDSLGDLIVGCPNESREGLSRVESGGAIVLFGSVRYQTPNRIAGQPVINGSAQFVDQSTLGGATNPEHYDHFGSALAALDINGDGVDDLAVGVPGETLSEGPSLLNSGVVNTAFGKRGTGIDVGVTHNITQLTPATVTYGVEPARDDTAQEDDAFGSSVTSARIIYEGTPRPALLIGSPGEDVGAGTLHVLIADPAEGFAVPLVRAVLRDGAAPGGHFGHAAVAFEQKLVCVSAPGRGGEVSCFDLSRGFDGVLPRTLQQPVEGAGEGAERGDDFGWSLAAWNGLLAVGAPGEERRPGSCNHGVVETYDPHSLLFQQRYEDATAVAFGSGLAPYVDMTCAVSSASLSPGLVAP